MDALGGVSDKGRAMPHEDPRIVVKRYLHEVVSGFGPARPEELVGSEALRQKVAAFRMAFPDLVVTTRVLLAEGALVAVHLTGRGTHRGMFLGIPASGRSWAASCSALYRVEEGRISDVWVNWDTLGILEQLGGVRRAASASA